MLYELNGEQVGDFELPTSVTNPIADAEGARLFFDELIASVETLGNIADQHGVNTLTDLMYLQQAILKGEIVQVWPGESAVGKVIQILSSVARWLKYTDLGEESK